MKRNIVWLAALGACLACPVALAADLDQAFYENALDRVRSEAQAVLEREPGNREARAWLARALYRQGRFAEAEAALAKVGTDNVTGLLADGDYALFIADDARARASFERARAMAPDNLEAMLGLASALVNLGQYDAALALARRAEPVAARTGPHQHSTAKTVLGGALGLKVENAPLWEKLRLAGEVRRNLEQAVEIDSRNPITHFALGRYYLQAPGIVGGDQQKAVATLRRAVALDPNYCRAQAWLIRSLERSGRDASPERAAYRRKFQALPTAMKELGT